MKPAAAPAIFLDRDGTLMEEVHYCRDPREVRVFSGAVEALGSLAAAGFRLVIVTNQSGIGRGLFTEQDFFAVQNELLRQLAPAVIDATYFCPSAPENPDPRRKPAPGMVLEAVRDLGLDPARSWFVGDKAVDVECGRRAGTRTVLVKTGYGAGVADVLADGVTEDIAAAARFILSQPIPTNPAS